ncbi:chemotaxis protein CheB [Brevundimonas sp.]|uniref:chemotaxis protein CheB n=1 Tax=Brevundimonas sp. TaxID=1871086 RepID=UPI0028A12FCF|nr:chemotaxis protein CheB [Brevundimonas sp.]
MSATVKAIVIGASAGAVQSLLRILPPLPKDYGLPVLVVVHVPPDRSNVLAPLLRDRCQLTVKEAEDKELVSAGVVYVAPSDYHVLVETDESISLSGEEPVNYSRPSIDLLFESAADAYGDGLVGVILSGANEDGAAGLARLASVGGTALVEDPTTAYASTMPQAALDACPMARRMSLDEIGAFILKAGGT